MKLHLALDHRGLIPSFAVLTESRCFETQVTDRFGFCAGSIVVFDRGYSDFSWYKRLTEQGVFFVSRLRGNALYRVLERRSVRSESGLLCDQVIELTGQKSQRMSLPRLRRIAYRDPQTGRRYVFITNNFKLAASTICDIYRQRWQVELFFKWIKQHLQIKSFYGTSKNAVMTQIWIALCTYLLLAYLKFSSRIGWSLHQMTQLMQLNLFQRRPLLALLRGDPEPTNRLAHPNQMVLV